MTNFYYLYGYLPYRYFYFKKSLRTSTTTTTMRTSFTRMVTSTTTLLLGCRHFLRDIYIKKKYVFRSPDLDSGSNDYAYHVRPDGDVDTYWPVDGDMFWDPCGRSSPGTVTSIGSWYISPAGIHIAGTLEGNSCGTLRTSPSTATMHIM